MADFGLVIFKKDGNEANPLTKLLKKFDFFKCRLGSWIFYLFNRKAFNDGIEKIEIYDNLNAYIITLPITASELQNFNVRIIEGYISRICAGRSIGVCHMPSCCRNAYSQVYRPWLPTSIVYKSLLLEILDEVYTKSGLRIGSLDIVVIPGNNLAELLTIVKLLEPRIRYITVASLYREQADAQLSPLTEETGLAISICSDFKNVLKNADLVINLEDIAVISKFRTNPKSLIINFQDQGKSKIGGENTVINGVEYELPQKLQETLGQEALSFFGKKEMADIVICHNLELNADSSFNEAMARRVAGEIKERGLQITGFTGRRGVLRVENVLKAIRKEGCNI